MLPIILEIALELKSIICEIKLQKSKKDQSTRFRLLFRSILQSYVHKCEIILFHKWRGFVLYYVNYL